MKKEKIYNEAINGDEGFIEGEGYPSCDGEPCANVADEGMTPTDMLTDEAPEGTMPDAAAPKAKKSQAEAEAETVKADADAEWRDKYLRLQAEFDNYRKRTLREKMDLVETGGKEVLKAMLPVRDDVQRALDAMAKSDDCEALRRGVELISQKFTEALRQKGVAEMEAVGREFDPDLYEAVARFAAGEEQKGRVVEVVQTGYMLGDKVLRFAKVVVGE